MSKLHGSWIWYELMTTDAVAAKAFYEAVVGWSITPGTEPPLFYGTIANDDGGMTGGVMALSEEMLAGGARPAWLGYVGVDDVDTATAAIEAAGGKVLMPKIVIPQGALALVADCCGAPFYVMTPQMAPGQTGESTAFSRSLPGRCSWNELMAGDLDQALAFNTGLFGWTLPPAMDMGDFGPYQFLANGGEGMDDAFGAAMKKMPQVPVSAWNHYFRVPDIDDARATIAARGGTVMNGPMEVPGGDWIVQGMDPQGAFFCVVGQRKA